MTTQTERFAGLSIAEQETVITIDRETRRARIYTSDTRYINKLDKRYERKAVHRNNDGITAVEYDVPEKLVSFRRGIVKQNLTDEQKAAFVARMKNVREGKS
jgi:hypothetical protein